MLRMSLALDEYIRVGEDIRIVFLGGNSRQARIMIDAPKEINIVRSKALEKRIENEEERAKLHRYYPEIENEEKKENAQKYKKKSGVYIVQNKNIK